MSAARTAPAAPCSCRPARSANPVDAVESRSDPSEPTAPRSPLSAHETVAAAPVDPAAVAAFSAFYRMFVPTLVAFLIYQGARPADAAEIVQDTMTKAFQSWEQINHPQAWARRVASRGYARRIASIIEDPVEAPPEQRVPLLRTDTDADTLIERHEVLRLLALLPSRQRQVMAWTFDGYHPTDIAEELGMSSDAVRGSLFKARRALAAHLAAGKEADPQ